MLRGRRYQGVCHALADNGHKAFICTGRPLTAQDLLDLKPAGSPARESETIVMMEKVNSTKTALLASWTGPLKVVFEGGTGVMLKTANLCVSLVPAGAAL